jgi:Flp pilus assembly protein TadG
MRTFKKFFKSDNGAFTAIFAVMAPILIAGAGLAVDVGFWYSSKRDLQNAADAGALAGGFELLRSNSQAFASVEANGVAARNAGPGAQVTTTFPAGGLVQVVVQATAQTFFIGNFISNPPTIAATATAQVTQGQTSPPACLNLLASSGEGLRINGNGRVEMGDGCAVQVNSSDERAVVVNGEGRLVSDDVCVNGGVVTQSQASISSVPKTGCPPISNPYDFLEPFIDQLDDGCRDRPANTLGSAGGREGRATSFFFNPATTQANQITVQNGITVTIGQRDGSPVPICFDLTVRSGGTLIIQGTILFVNGARLNVQAGGNLIIREPFQEIDLFNGLSIISSERNNVEHTITGGGNISISPGRGISVPGATIDINGNSNLSSASVSITAKSLRVGGNTTVRLGTNPPNQPVQPRAGQDGGVRLIN